MAHFPCTSGCQPQKADSPNLQVMAAEESPGARAWGERALGTRYSCFRLCVQPSSSEVKTAAYGAH